MNKKYGFKTKPKNLIRLSILSACVILICALCVTVAAYMLKNSKPVENTFDRAIVSCEAIEQFDSSSGVKSSISVKNTGNIPAFVRVYLVSSWQDDEGNVLPMESEIPPFDLADGWAETAPGIYEYKYEIAPNAETPNLLSDTSVITLATDPVGRIQVIDVFAEAIQSNPVTAKQEAWQ